VRPTESRPVDIVLLFLCGAALTWAASTAPWWAVATAGGLSAALAKGAFVWVGVLSAAAVMIVPPSHPVSKSVRQVSTIGAIVTFAEARVVGFHGLTSLIACTALIAVAVTGVIRRPRIVRRRVLAAFGGVAALTFAAIVLLGISAFSARTPLNDGEQQARAAIDELNRGDLAAAASGFEVAAESFRDARGKLDGPLGVLGRALPVVAQNRSAVAELSAGAEEATRLAANALRQIDPDSVRVVNGRIDVAAISALAVPFEELADSLTELRTDVERAGSPWLLPQITRRLAPLADDLDRNNSHLARARHAIDVAPALLGATGTRRYFVAFTTPAEARALGGFMGNWAELTITDGHIVMTDFGRTNDLNQGGPEPEERHLAIPDEFVARWTADLLDADGTTDLATWSNITKPPDFPTVGRMISELYPQSGGRSVDGVLLLDVEAIAALLNFTGPLEIEGAPEPLTAENTAQFLLTGQYEIAASDERVDLLERIAQETVRRLLTTALPPPAELAAVLSPVTQEGRLLAWSSNSKEQALFEEIGMAGAFPRLDGGDGFAVTVDNEAANKADAYLRVDGSYESTVDATTGAASGRLMIRLHNDAPAEGLPDYVIGNPLGLPKGTNRMRLSVYTALPITSVTVNGEPATMEFDDVFGWHVGMRYVAIPPGQTTEVVVTTSGTLIIDESDVTTWTQPLAIAPSFQIVFRRA